METLRKHFYKKVTATNILLSVVMRHAGLYRLPRFIKITTQSNRQSLLRATDHARIEPRTGLFRSVRLEYNTAAPHNEIKGKPLNSSMTLTDVSTIFGPEFKRE